MTNNKTVYIYIATCNLNIHNKFRVIKRILVIIIYTYIQIVLTSDLYDNKEK